jgi:proline iminopeptidase
MKTLYPALEPFHQFYLDTGSVHQVYVEQSGNPAGIPVIFLHGGPCSGTKPDHRRFFNPARYHIILMDQRGSGLSKPYGERQANTTAELVADMEQIRQQLRLDQWLLFGGSWGVTLALCYAQQHPQRVSAMILRGSFLARMEDMAWFLGPNGVSRIYPQRWQALCDSVDNPAPEALLTALCDAILGSDDNRARRAAQQWAQWGGQVALGNAFQANDEALSERELLQVKLELHYAQHHYFIGDTPLLEHCQALHAIPTVIIHGQQDLTCPLEAGWRLHLALPQAEWIVLPDAGHIARGESMIDALVSATDTMALQL